MKNKSLIMAMMISAVAFTGCGSSGSAAETTASPAAHPAAESVQESAADTTENREAVETGEQSSEGPMRDGNGGGGPNRNGRSMAVNNLPEFQELIDANYEKFQQFTFQDTETGISLDYNLYIPENYDTSLAYPLVLYMTDATGTGKTAEEIVSQYYGANVWITAEEQEKHPSFVLVPAFIETVVDDDFNHSEQIEVVLRIIEDLQTQYSIDADRLYTTGQSSGGMTSFYINSTYPDIFAASLYMASQWDIHVLSGLENQNFFYIVAGGDAKASAGQDQVIAMFDEDNAGYSYGEWSAQDDRDSQNAAVQALMEQNTNANMVRFTAGSTLNGTYNMEHMTSFNYCYNIPAVRGWLFAQSK